MSAINIERNDFRVVMYKAEVQRHVCATAALLSPGCVQSNNGRCHGDGKRNDKLGLHLNYHLPLYCQRRRRGGRCPVQGLLLPRVARHALC